MKVLSERTEFSPAINFKEYPVVAIDLSKRDDYGLCGAKVCIDAGSFKDGKPHYIRAALRTYNDERKLTFSSGCTVLSDQLYYEDFAEMLEYANVPVIGPDQEILVCCYDSENRQIYAPVLLRTGKMVSPYCQTPLGIEEFYPDVRR